MSPSNKWTELDEHIDSLRPKKQRYHIQHPDVPGLELRITSRGTKSWSLRHRPDDCDRQARATLGQWPKVTEQSARKKAERIIEESGTRRKEQLVGGSYHGLETKRFPLPKRGTVKRYILTCAQNNTHVHSAAWESIKALAKHYDAEILVSRFAYNKNAYAQIKSAKPDHDPDRHGAIWYDPELVGHFSDERIALAPALVWCGESNISPTAVRPLSGLESYTGRRSAVFPHVKVAMESVASGRFEDTKLLFTTGTVTQRNYIQRKAGLKAEFHHTYGGLLVEVNHKGRWYCRQLNASRLDGTIYDLDLRAKNGKVTGGHRVEAITFGDMHTSQLDSEVAQLGWGADGGSMINVLRPREVHLHDLVDFRARHHYDRGNCHVGFERFIEDDDSVQEELKKSVTLIHDIRRSSDNNSRVVVVQSNHDNALTRWLREADYRQDPLNALIYLKCQKRMYESIADRDENFHLVGWVLYELGCPEDVRFLREDESYIICHDANDGIECGMHGHDGANGSRGAPMGFRKMGRKTNTGHTHSACIIEGVYVAGTSSKLSLGYTKGPSSWTHSHIITYENGKRAIITMYDGAWKA